MAVEADPLSHRPGLIRHLSTKEEGADTFIPFLIYVVLKANPEHLVSNLQCVRLSHRPRRIKLIPFLQVHSTLPQSGQAIWRGWLLPLESGML